MQLIYLACAIVSALHEMKQASRVILFTAIILFSLCNIHAHGQGEPFIFRHLDKSNGTASINVGTAAQDSSGFLWLATTNGLQRYDGYHFVTYRHVADDPYSLPSDLIEEVLCDKQNNIWIITVPFAIYRLDHYRKHFVPVVLHAARDSARFISISPDGKVWATGPRNIFQYDDKHGKFIPIASIPAADSVKIISPPVFDTVNHLIWLAANDGIWLYDEKKNKIESCTHANDRYFIPESGGIQNLFPDHLGNLWVSTYLSELYCYDVSKKNLKHYGDKLMRHELNEDSVHNLYYSYFAEDRYGHLWISTFYGGLLSYDRTTDQFHAFRYFPWNPKSIRYDVELLKITFDREGNLWIGSDEGLNYFNPAPSLFTNFFYHPSDKKSFPNAPALAFLQSSPNEIWAATYEGGLVKMDSQFRVQKIYNSDLGKKNAPFATENKFWALARDGNGKIWIGGQHGTISVFDSASNTFEQKLPDGLHHQTVSIMRSDVRGNIWIANIKGSLLEWDIQKQKFISYDNLLKEHKMLSDWIYDLYVDSAENVWIASAGHGLIKINASHANLVNYIPDDGDKLSEDSDVLAVNYFGKWQLVLGTLNNGVYIFNTTTNKFQRLKPNDGSFDSFITGISAPVEKQLWIASENGLSTFDLTKSDLVNYSEGDGIFNDSYNSTIYSVGKKLLVGNGTGFLAIDPHYFSHASSPGIVRITGLTIFNQTTTIDSIVENNLPLKLSYHQNFITLSFIFPSYKQTRSLFYSYQLKGLDPAWRTTQNPEAVYTGLKGGHYTFLVRCENYAGQKGPITQLSIIITPPFWQTTWFYILCTLLLLAIIIFIYYNRIYHIRKKERERAATDRRIQEMKLTVLRTQLNPHFMFNSLNAIQSFILNSDEEQATSFLSKFAKLMRLVLDTSQRNLIPLHDEMEMIRLYLELENLRLSNSLKYEVKVDEQIQQMETFVPPLLIQPCLENSIWHGLMNRDENRNLFLSVFLKDDLIYFQLEDNGIGRAAALEIRKRRVDGHLSKGISIVEERLELLSKQTGKDSFMQITDLHDEERKSTGTRVSICIPNRKKT
jgi:ligand-binding sensor domain-containing protein